MMNTILPADSHFFTVDNLFEMGLSYYKIKKLVEEGTLVKVNKSMYENANYEGEESDFSVVAAYAPKGVVCMLSAARYYGLTTYLPDAVDIAIERSSLVNGTMLSRLTQGWQ